MTSATENEPMETTVFIVDDSADFRQVASQFLGLVPGLRVTGSAADGESALRAAGQLRPDLFLVDLNMPGLSGLETIPRLRAMLPNALIVALTMMEPITHRQASLEAGADEFISKAQMDTELLPALQRLLNERHN